MTKSYTVKYLSEQGVRDNEDSIVVDESNNLFAVFDGASSLTAYRSPDGKTGAREASEIARDTFLGNPCDDLASIALLANENISRRHAELFIDASEKANRFSCTAAAVYVGRETLSILQNSDSLVIIKDQTGRVYLPINYHDHDIEVMKKWRDFADEGYTDILSLIWQDAVALRQESNATYGVLDGSPEAANFLKTTKVNREEIDSILILSDGLFIPKVDPEAEDDWSQAFRLCEDGGLQLLYATVRELEKSDPQLTRYPRYKIHDDASGIYIKFS